MKDVVLSPAWLPWDRNSGEEKLFLKALTIAIAVSMLLGALVPLIKVPEQKRADAEAIPPRLARMLTDRKPPEPPKTEKKVEEQAEQAVGQVPMTEARRKAASSGVLAMSKQLAALSSMSVLQRATSHTTLSSGGGQVANVESAMVSNATVGSSGIDTTSLVREKQAEAKLDDHTTTQVELNKEDKLSVEKQVVLVKSESKSETPKRIPKRDQDAISEMLDRNKGAVYAIYNRALRQNALLAGNVVFSITIEPSGKVSDCHVVSSELHDEELERKLSARIAMISFGAEAVPQLVVKWPINFLPN